MCSLNSSTTSSRLTCVSKRRKKAGEIGGEKLLNLSKIKLLEGDCLQVISMKNRFRFYRPESVTSLRGKEIQGSQCTQSLSLSVPVCKSLCHVDSIMILSGTK